MTATARPLPSAPRVPVSWLFGSFALPFMIMQGPGLAILPNLYAEHFHFNLATLGVTLLLVRIVFDALLNPIVALCSDRTESRFGQRKPWLLAGAALGTVGIFNLYVPGDAPTLAGLS